MIFLIVFNLTVVFFAYMAHAKKTDFFLKISFTLIFGFLAIRYDYGNDYQNYLERFIAINQGVLFWESEPGWVFLCRLFKPFGFFAMVAVIAAIQCYIYYRFFIRYIPQKYYWFAIFIYLFNPLCFLVLSSAMRQSVAVMIFVRAIDYIYKRDAIKYFISIGVASLFHTSAFILLPIYLIVFLNFRINKFSGVILFILYPLMYFSLTYLQNYTSYFVEIYFQGYEKYLDRDIGELGTGIGFLFSLLVLALIIIKMKSLDEIRSVPIYVISLVGYYIMPVSFINPMMGRIGMYFEVYIIAAFIFAIQVLRQQYLRFGVVLMYAVITLVSFSAFFNNEIWKMEFEEYKTIFSSEQIY